MGWLVLGVSLSYALKEWSGGSSDDHAISQSIHMNIHIYIYLCIYIHIFIYIYKYIYIYIQKVHKVAYKHINIAIYLMP
jgi:hypothetical protein